MNALLLCKARRSMFRDRYASNNGKPWTTADRRMAIELRGKGLSYAQIAIKVHRTPDAVSAHLRSIGEAAR